MAAKKSKVSKKTQGTSVSGASRSSANEQRLPRTQERGIGSSYIMAVNSIMDQAKQISGSKQGFLGVEKQTIDPKEHACCTILPEKFDPRKK